MRVGLVHFGGHMGDLVRVEAIREFLCRRGLLTAEYRLEQRRPPVDMIRELTTGAGLRHLGRKIFADRAHPMLKELHWRIEARQWEENVERAWADMGSSRPGVDVLLAETLFAALVCLRAKERYGIPFVFDMHGILREESRLAGSAEWAAWCSRWERIAVEAADRVVSVSPLMSDYLAREYGVGRDRVALAPNGTHLPARTAAWARPQAIVYAGSFAAFENILEVVKAAEVLGGRQPFWVLGDGPMRNEVLDYVNGRHVEIVYFGRRRRDAALDLCANAQIAISGQTGAADLARDHPRQLGCPIKLFDYAACGLPIVAPPGEWAPVLRDADCAVISSSASAASLAEAVGELDDEAAWTRLARNARALAAGRFQWPNVLEPLSAALGGA